MSETSQFKKNEEKLSDPVIDEDMGELDLREIDLIGIEDACSYKSYRCISSKQIQLLKEALA